MITKKNFHVLIASFALLTTLSLFYLKGAHDRLLNLDDFIQHSQIIEEFPEPDNKNPLIYRYSTYHKTINYGPIKSLFKKNPNEITKHFISLIKSLDYSDLNPLSAKAGYKDEDNTYVFLQNRKNNNVYIWADLYGAFHSLTRSLTYLNEQGVIDRDLKITDPKTYFVFEGNLINRSPYNIEILTLVFTLIKKNPKQIVYLKGRHEENDFWMDYNFKKELRTRLPRKDISATPYKNELSEIFKKLPSGILFRENNEYVLISPKKWNGRLNLDLIKKVSFDNKSRFFKESDLFLSESAKPTDKLLYIIKPETDISSLNYLVPTGLNLYSPHFGAARWSPFASPTKTYEVVYNFTYDCFINWRIKNSFRNSPLVLYKKKNHTKKKKNNFRTQFFHPLTGQMHRTEKAYYKKTPLLNEYKVTSILDLSGSVKVIGHRLKLGTDLRFREFNAKQEIPGLFIRQFFLDDEYEPRKTRKNLKIAKEYYGTSLLFSPLGTPTVNAINELEEIRPNAILFPYTGSPLFRQKNDNFIHFRASYADEIESMVSYAVKDLNLKKFGIFYQNDSYGTLGLNSAIEILDEKYKINDQSICAVPYKRNTLEIMEAAQHLNECNPDGIFFFSTFSPSVALIEAMGIENLNDKTLMALSFVSDRFKLYASDSEHPNYHSGKGLDFIMSRVVGNPSTSKLKIVKNYRRMMKKYYPGILHDPDSLEGYINASLLIEAMKNISPPYTENKILKQLESFEEKDFEGLKLKFDPKSRSYSQDVSLDVSGKKEWIKMAQ